MVVTGEGADAQTERTGLIKSMNPMTPGAGVTGLAFMAAEAVDEATTNRDETKDRAHVQAVQARPLTIGKVVDSADDMARLMLVTHYDGTNSVKVYAKADADPDDDPMLDLTGRLGSDGRIQTEGVDDDEVDNVFVSLKSVGTYYQATGGQEGEDGNVGLNQLDHTDLVGAKAAAKEVFSYTDLGTGGDEDTTVYVVLQSLPIRLTHSPTTCRVLPFP